MSEQYKDEDVDRLLVAIDFYDEAVCIEVNMARLSPVFKARREELKEAVAPFCGVLKGANSEIPQ